LPPNTDRKSWSFGSATISASPTEAFGWPAWRMRLTSSSTLQRLGRVDDLRRLIDGARCVSGICRSQRCGMTMFWL
jgi:hypothetical protein